MRTLFFEMSRKTYNTRSKKGIENGDIVRCVDDVLFHYCKIEPYLTFPGFRNKNFVNENDDNEAIMKSENLVLNEINADLWDRALLTTLDDITSHCYPHFTVIQKFINYVLNSDYVDFGMVMNLFTKLLLFHPPNNVVMQNYYWHILNDKYVQLTNAKEEEKNIFWCLIEAVTSCLASKEYLEADEENYFQKRLESCKDEILGLVKNLNKKNGCVDYLILQEKTQMCFDALLPVRKFQRSMIILNFLYDILEADFLHRTRSDGFDATKGKKCLFSAILWDNFNETGFVNSPVRKLIHNFKLMEEIKLNHAQQVHKKLMTLLSEVIRLSDFSNNLAYPFFGDNSNSLASELAIKFVETLVENYNRENMSPVKDLKPHWLRLLVCSRLLSYLTGKSCPPELTSVLDVMKYLNSLTVLRNKRNRSKRIRKKKKIETLTNLNPGSEYCYTGCKLKFKKNKRARTSDDYINDVNERGWGALHLAILLGHEGCVNQLLDYRSGKRKGMIDTRLRGANGFTPLMCAVLKNQTNICRLLLEHSGPGLVQDVSDAGQTPLDLCQDRETADIIKSFGGNRISKQGGKHFNFTREDTLLVVDLCVQLVESYFVTHRTLDVHKRLGRNLYDTGNINVKKKEIKLNYARYQSDIHTNISQLVEVLEDIQGIKEIGDLLRPLYLILHYIKL